MATELGGKLKPQARIEFVLGMSWVAKYFSSALGVVQRC
jgi:hypothetical protein